MPNQPHLPNGGQSQTLLELIYALKGLAQTIELYHQDLSRLLQDESKERHRELERLKELISKNSQTLQVLPITFSDRVEKLLKGVEDNLDRKLEETHDRIQDVINDVRVKLSLYEKSAERLERAVSESDAVPEDSMDDVTGRIELTKKGEVKLLFSSSLLHKLWIFLVVVAAGGGTYSIAKVLQAIFGG